MSLKHNGDLDAKATADLLTQWKEDYKHLVNDINAACSNLDVLSQ
jgi:hypothetical protein